MEQVGKQRNEKRRDCEYCAMRHINGRVLVVGGRLAGGKMKKGHGGESGFVYIGTD